jgi:hypothetical protein
MTPTIYDYKNPSYCGLIYTATHPDTDKQFDYIGETERTFDRRMTAYIHFPSKTLRPIEKALVAHAEKNNKKSIISSFTDFQFTPFCSIWKPSYSKRDSKRIGLWLESHLILEYQTLTEQNGLNDKLKHVTGNSKRTTDRHCYNDGVKEYRLYSDDPKIEQLNLVRGRLKVSTKGRKIYNNGVKNFMLFPGDPAIEECNLVQGEIPRNKNFVKGRHSYNNGKESWKLFDDDPRIQKENLKKGAILKTTKLWYVNDQNEEFYIEPNDPRIQKENLKRGRRPHLNNRNHYNDGKRNYMCSSDDPRIKELNLVLGFIWINEPPVRKGRKLGLSQLIGTKWFNDGEKDYRLKSDDPKAKTLTRGRKKAA